MPTINPRVNVTLSPSLDALVSRLAVLQRSSKSQVLRELLEAAEPALHRAVALMDAASKASSELHAKLARSMEAAQDLAEDSAAVMLSRMDRAVNDLVSEAEAVRGRRPARKGGASAAAAAPGARNPPPSNRGVKSAQSGGRLRAHPSQVKSPKGVKS